ncbi:MAG: hypothetical protein DMF91_06565 [Acidobacteria bacterium]|nr:MAG: hypothetical protein DMF91_06565 [Acidobacteriota bacterium]
MVNSGSTLFEFGPFRLDLRTRRLTRSGESVNLAPKAFDTLALMVLSRGRLVDKAELMKTLWPDTFVEERNIVQQMFLVRKILGEQPDGRPYIETVPKHGYLFAAPVTEVGETGAELTPAPKWHGRRAVVAACVLGAIASAVAYWRVAQRHAEASIQPSVARSLAVLPFRSLVSAGDDEYLNLGLTDALITRLANVRGLTVRPTSSVLKYDRAARDPQAAARELKVDSVIDGNIQRVDDRIRVTVQLLSVRDGTPLWADHFDEPARDLFSVQDAISERVVTALVANVGGGERNRRVARRAPDPEAYELYLRGRYFLSKRTRTSLERAREYFDEAVRKDPAFAAAYAAIADAHILLAVFTPRPQRPSGIQARAAVLKALQLDSTLGEAHTSLGLLELEDCQYAEAGRDFERAIDEAPGYPTAYQWYSLYLKDLGRYDEAVSAIRQAEKLDPSSLVINADVSLLLYFARRYDEAIEHARKTIEMDPGFYLPHFYLAMAYEAKGRYRDALAECAVMRRLHDGASRIVIEGRVYAQTDRLEEARLAEQELNALAGKQYVPPLTRAYLPVGLRDVPRVIRWLEAAAAEGTCLRQVVTDPRFDLVRSDPQFNAFLVARGFLTNTAPQIR